MNPRDEGNFEFSFKHYHGVILQILSRTEILRRFIRCTLNNSALTFTKLKKMKANACAILEFRIGNILT